MNEVFKSKVLAIEEDRDYEGRNPVLAGLIEDCNVLRSELLGQKEHIMHLLVANEYLEEQIEASKAATAHFRKIEQELGGL